jgi:hypothetical protein
MPRRN